MLHLLPRHPRQLVPEPLRLGEDGPPHERPRLGRARGEQLRDAHAGGDRVGQPRLVPARVDEGREDAAAEHHLREGAGHVHDEGGGVLEDGAAVAKVGEVCRGGFGGVDVVVLVVIVRLQLGMWRGLVERGERGRLGGAVRGREDCERGEVKLGIESGCPFLAAQAFDIDGQAQSLNVCSGSIRLGEVQPRPIHPCRVVPLVYFVNINVRRDQRRLINIVIFLPDQVRNRDLIAQRLKLLVCPRLLASVPLIHAAQALAVAPRARAGEGAFHLRSAASDARLWPSLALVFGATAVSDVAQISALCCRQLLKNQGRYHIYSEAPHCKTDTAGH